MPLNEVLYNRLVQKYGNENVSIVRPGEPHIPNWQFDPITGRRHREPTFDGEAYRLSCPFCGDKKGRLYVNHFWMQWDQESMRHADDLIRCFNEENCFSDPATRSAFFQILFSGSDVSDVNMSIKHADAPAEEIKATPPGHIIPLTSLPADHPCCTYLQGRGYNVETLSTWWNVGYVASLNQGFHSSWLNRIYIPMYHSGELVGYQCRYVGDREWTDDCPKSRTMYRMKRGRHLYNMDVAVRSRVVVVTEGPTSAWAIGSRAVALWGRSITATHVELLRSHWGEKCLIVVMLDGDAALDSDKATVKLRAHCPTPVLQVKLLNSNDDPGSLGETNSWNLILEEANKRGIDLMSYFTGENIVAPVQPVIQPAISAASAYSAVAHSTLLSR